MAEELVFKLIEVMRELLPKTRNVTIIFNPTNSSDPLMLGSVLRQFANSDLVIGSVAVRCPPISTPRSAKCRGSTPAR